MNSLNAWLQGKKPRPRKTEKEKERDLFNPNPSINMCIISNLEISHVVKLEDIKSAFANMFRYEVLLTASDRTLARLVNLFDCNLDNKLWVNLGGLPKNSLFYFIKEFAKNTNRPHYHGFIAFKPSNTAKDPYMNMVKKFYKWRKQIESDVGYVQYCRINNMYNTYSPTEQNLMIKRHVGNMGKYYMYIHKGVNLKKIFGQKYYDDMIKEYGGFYELAE